MVPEQDDAEVAEFDPSLGLVIAATWWALGRRLGAFHRDEPGDSRIAAARDWVEKLVAERGDELGPDTRAALTPARVQDFGETVIGLLEKKYRGAPIAREVVALTSLIANVEVEEDGQFLKLHEEPEVWWAAEYCTVFDSLAKFDDEPGWIEAAGICANETCQRFFIKRRANQQYHSDLCQAATANRRSYRKKRAATAHHSLPRSSR